MKNVLIIGGNGMTVGDGSAYWMLAITLTAMGFSVRIRECLETGTGENRVSGADVLWADAVVSYSYGTASLKAIWHDLAQTMPPEKRYALWVIVAGVPDFWMTQYYGTLWHLPGFVASGVCFQVSDVPASCDFQGPGFVTNFKFGTLLPNELGNVHCDNLFPAITAPSAKHIGIKEKPEVLDAIVSLFTALLSSPAVAPSDVPTSGAAALKGGA